MNDLYLVFETDYVCEGEEYTYLTNTAISAEVAKRSNPTDKQLIDEVIRVQSELFTDCVITEVRVNRLSYFEYRKYLKENGLTLEVITNG
ncbi:hypothetical protein [Gracilibacillus lacisalsi]|uniref:hypothetical protein n=1 Tax=Gracilibacillus lacisalsi TaxID=393087 RepID=UPI0003614595|nr:hypothetical protein [Gracilibacillus lacisalsi]